MDERTAAALDEGKIEKGRDEGNNRCKIRTDRAIDCLRYNIID